MQRSSSGNAYFLPWGGQEIDRLDIQHYAFTTSAGGLHAAPIEAPLRVLDVGCGTGQWCFDMCAGLPNARIVGMDLHDSKTTNLANYRFVRGNLLHGLPFGDATFDLVHQRFLITGIPLMHWSRAVSELVRVTRPGGWLELVECLPFMTPEGVAANRIWSIFRKRMRKAGLDTTGHVHKNLDGYLREEGLVDVGSRTVLVPIGDWAEEVGVIMKTDLRTLAMQVSPLLATTYHVSVEAQWALIQEMLDELEAVHPHLSCRIAYGQRRTPPAQT